MGKYIDNAAVVAEIEARYNECLKQAKLIDAEYWNGKADAYRDMLVVLDTLEVKDADLEKEIEWIKHIYKVDNNRHTSICLADIEWLAEHFFELGLKAQKGE